MKGRILSGMRPTGQLHLGHLVGALQNWVNMQNEYECFYMVADWHALMSEYNNSENISKFGVDNVIDWIACGVDPEKNTIFIQSAVPEHTELHMVLSCITPLGWLERCPTYKEQLKELEQKEINTYAFLGYPVLQTADIILYKANVVPVGEDQLPHLELAREIVRRFHFIFKREIFPEPAAKLTQAPRLLGLDSRKMSKSYGNYISLSEKPEDVRKKIMTMITDPARIKRTDKGHPDVCNVFSYYKIFAPEKSAGVEIACKEAQIGCTDCKKNLADIIISILQPVYEKRRKLTENPEKIHEILRNGADKARKIAIETMKEVRYTALGK
ncbi:MAG: tryptophan--tRNA ligase [Planctomycetes bacterium]|nr:tryptophan--tRNA ligase [Planctomycetota bacterium]